MLLQQIVCLSMSSNQFSVNTVWDEIQSSILHNIGSFSNKKYDLIYEEHDTKKVGMRKRKGEGSGSEKEGGGGKRSEEK